MMKFARGDLALVSSSGKSFLVVVEGLPVFIDGSYAIRHLRSGIVGLSPEKDLQLIARATLGSDTPQDVWLRHIWAIVPASQRCTQGTRHLKHPRSIHSIPQRVREQLKLQFGGKP